MPVLRDRLLPRATCPARSTLPIAADSRPDARSDLIPPGTLDLRRGAAGPGRALARKARRLSLRAEAGAAGCCRRYARPEHDAGAESVSEPLVEVVSGPPVDVIHSRRSWPWSMRKGRSSHRSVIPYARWPTGDRWPSPYRAMCFVCAGASQRRSFSAEDIALGPVCATPAQRLLDRIGQQPGKLSCGVRPPLDLSPRGSCSGVAVEPTILGNECSGKHIGMLSLAARHAVGSYASLEHPVQQEVLRNVAASLASSRVKSRPAGPYSSLC